MYEGLKDDSKRIQVFNLTMNEMINKVCRRDIKSQRAKLWCRCQDIGEEIRSTNMRWRILPDRKVNVKE